MSPQPPDHAKLYEAALHHLSRYAATTTSLSRVLSRRLDRWRDRQIALGEDAEHLSKQMRAAKAAIPAVIEQLVLAGVLNDNAFAASRAKRLAGQGKSRRATMAHLAAKGIAAPTIPIDEERELGAACAYLRRRRAGPFGDMPTDKILAALARGGFSQDVARQALKLDRETAEGLIKKIRA